MRIQILVFFFLFSCFCLNAQLMMESVEASDTTTFIYQMEGEEPLRFKVEIVGDLLIADGDMIVGSLADLDTGRGGAISRDANKRWPLGFIPYEIAPNHPLTSQIHAAFEDLSKRTNLVILPRINIDRRYLYIDYNPDYGCVAQRGMAGERTLMYLNPECSSQGVIQHQMLHVAGFLHEQMRRDRGEYIKIVWDNIWLEKHGIFKKYAFGTATAIGKYDYESIMQYSGYTDDPQIAKDINKPIIITKDPSKQDLLGSGTLSANDIRQINRVYKGGHDNDAFTGRNRKKVPKLDSTVAGLDSTVAGLEIASFVVSKLFKSVWGDVFSGSKSGQKKGDAQAGVGATGIEGGAISRLSKKAAKNIPFLGGRGGQSNQLFNIQYEVELVPQQTGFSCWAAGAAMLVGWYDRVSINPEEIANQIDYWAQYDSKGLAASDMKMLNHWFLQAEPPQSYTVEGFVQMLGAYGPLWVATNEGNPHIRVIAGASGDGTPEGTILTIYDPWQRGMRRFRSNNTGSVYQETFAEFERKNHELAGREMKKASPIYVAHNY